MRNMPICLGGSAPSPSTSVSRFRSSDRVAAVGSGIGLLSRDASPTERSTERVLREVFWRSGNERPPGTLSSLADARAIKLQRSGR